MQITKGKTSGGCRRDSVLFIMQQLPWGRIRVKRRQKINIVARTIFALQPVFPTLSSPMRQRTQKLGHKHRIIVVLSLRICSFCFSLRISYSHWWSSRQLKFVHSNWVPCIWSWRRMPTSRISSWQKFLARLSFYLNIVYLNVGINLFIAHLWNGIFVPHFWKALGVKVAMFAQHSMFFSKLLYTCNKNDWEV